MENDPENIQEKEREDIPNESGYYDKKPKFVNRGPSRFRETWNQGKVYFLVVAACILFYFALLRLTNITGVLWKIVDVLTPIVYGVVIAYLLNPLVKKIERLIQHFFSNRIRRKEKAAKLLRGISIFISLVLFLVLITGLLNLVIPELYKSIRNLVFTLPSQVNSWINILNEIKLDDSVLGMLLKNILTESAETFQTWLRTDLLKQTNVIMSSLTEGVLNVLSTLINFLIGLIVSAYLLFSKDVFSAQAKKALYAFLKPEHANMTLHITKKSNEIFGGFIIGKFIDSAIIGVLCFLGLCFLGLWVDGMPYVMLVSVIVGVTNVIPFFGPYIGAIPSAILILLEDPKKGIYFIIFIFLLQQLDGNVIGPKILGNSTGLSAFWVVFSILLGGGLFGFVGMIMGAPTFGLIYYIVQVIINQKLEKKNLPVHSENYDQQSYVKDEGQYARTEENEKEN
ncbi:MAG: AI-2E family transporter [Lachnospiraceae bacterium]